MEWFDLWRKQEKKWLCCSAVQPRKAWGGPNFRNRFVTSPGSVLNSVNLTARWNQQLSEIHLNSTSCWLSAGIRLNRIYFTVIKEWCGSTTAKFTAAELLANRSARLEQCSREVSCCRAMLLSDHSKVTAATQAVLLICYTMLCSSACCYKISCYSLTARCSGNVVVPALQTHLAIQCVQNRAYSACFVLLFWCGWLKLMGDISRDCANPMTFPALCRYTKWALEGLLSRLHNCGKIVRSTNCCRSVHTTRASFRLCSRGLVEGCNQQTVQSITVFTLVHLCVLFCQTNNLLHRLCHIEFPTYRCIMICACWSWYSVPKSVPCQLTSDGWRSGSMTLRFRV